MSPATAGRSVTTTTSTDAEEAPVYVQLVTFKLDGPTEDEYHDACREDAATFAALPGLLGKIWLRDAEAGTYGGLYLWEDREAHDAYVRSDVFKAIQDDASLRDVRSRGFDHFEDLTKATQPRLALA